LVAIGTTYSSDVVDVIVVPRMRRILKNCFQVAKWVGKVGGNRYNI